MMIRPAVTSDLDLDREHTRGTMGLNHDRHSGPGSVTPPRSQALVAVGTSFDQPQRVGLLTYQVDRDGLEIVTIDALRGPVRE